MGMYGNDFEYANSRLEGTVVRFEGKPVYLHNVTRGMKANVAYLSSLDDLFNVEVSELDLKPIPLGYCNKGGKTSYLMRMPMRRDWRQGTRLANMHSNGDFGVDRLSYKDLEDVVVGKYPTLAQCIKAVVSNSVRSMAWCREWALSGSNVMYKSEVVGQIINGSIVLNEDSSYLSQALGEVS